MDGFLGIQVVERSLDIGVKGISSLINSFFMFRSLLPVPLSAEFLLSPGEVFVIILNIFVNSEVRNEVVLGIVILLLRVLVLGAS